MAQYDELFAKIATLTIGNGKPGLGWEIVGDLRNAEDFPYEELSDADLAALKDMIADYWFCAEMSDCYATTKKEQAFLQPVSWAVNNTIKNRAA